MPKIIGILLPYEFLTARDEGKYVKAPTASEMEYLVTFCPRFRSTKPSLLFRLSDAKSEMKRVYKHARTRYQYIEEDEIVDEMAFLVEAEDVEVDEGKPTQHYLQRKSLPESGARASMTDFYITMDLRLTPSMKAEPSQEPETFCVLLGFLPGMEFKVWPARFEEKAPSLLEQVERRTLLSTPELVKEEDSDSSSQLGANSPI